jgi:transcriptional regulator with XRE-family HTH domain
VNPFVAGSNLKKHRMKQPELGKKITELRKAKGWTQEELVEKCNVSVRTIQRIETGEVTPRTYTVKTILAALDFDLNQLGAFVDDKEQTSSGFLKNIFLLNADTENHDVVSKQLNIAGALGIVYFVVSFLESAAEYFRFAEQQMIFSEVAYVSIKLVTWISFFYFQRAFIALGVLSKNYLLKTASLVQLALCLFLALYDIASLYYDSIERPFVVYGSAFSHGVIGIVYGIALRRLEYSVGRMAEIAGIAQIVAACFFLTMVLAPFGLLFLVPSELACIIILFKAAEIVKAKHALAEPLPSDVPLAAKS